MAEADVYDFPRDEAEKEKSTHNAQQDNATSDSDMSEVFGSGLVIDSTDRQQAIDPPDQDNEGKRVSVEDVEYISAESDEELVGMNNEGELSMDAIIASKMDDEITRIPIEHLFLGCEIEGWRVRDLEDEHLQEISEFLINGKQLSSFLIVNKIGDDKFVVLDGNHRLKIMKDIRDEYNPDAYGTIKCIVYEGLTSNEAKCVAFAQNQKDGMSLKATEVGTIEMIRDYMVAKPMVEGVKTRKYYFDLYKTLNITVNDSTTRRTASQMAARSEDQKKLEAKAKSKRGSLSAFIQMAKWPKEWWGIIKPLMEQKKCRASSFKALRGWSAAIQFNRIKTFAKSLRHEDLGNPPGMTGSSHGHLPNFQEVAQLCPLAATSENEEENEKGSEEEEKEKGHHENWKKNMVKSRKRPSQCDEAVPGQAPPMGKKKRTKVSDSQSEIGTLKDKVIKLQQEVDDGLKREDLLKSELSVAKEEHLKTLQTLLSIRAAQDAVSSATPPEATQKEKSNSKDRKERKTQELHKQQPVCKDKKEKKTNLKELHKQQPVCKDKEKKTNLKELQKQQPVCKDKEKKTNLKELHEQQPEHEIREEEYDFKIPATFFRNGDIVAVRCRDKKENFVHLGTVTQAPKGQGLQIEVAWLTDDKSSTSRFSKTLIIGKLVHYQDRWNGQQPVPAIILKQLTKMSNLKTK